MREKKPRFILSKTHYKALDTLSTIYFQTCFNESNWDVNCVCVCSFVCVDPFQNEAQHENTIYKLTAIVYSMH